MGQPSPHQPVLLIMAAFSRHEAALAWAKDKAVEHWGPLALESPRFDFAETHYYDASMGPGLKKVFFAFRRQFDPAELVDIKLETNRWEEEYAALTALGGQSYFRGDNGPSQCNVLSAAKIGTVLCKHPEPRPLNLDPGYLGLGKLVLASTKDFAHRIYLRQGIYAEVTLQYKHNAWRHHEYTFADYRREDYQRFFSKCREWLKGRRDLGI